MNISFNWENLKTNQYLEKQIYDRINKSFSKYPFLNDIVISIKRGNNNSRFEINLEATTNNMVEKLRANGVSCDVIPATNDLVINFKTVLKNYDENAFEKRKKLEEQWKIDAEKNREIKQKREEEKRAIIEENRRRAEQNEKTRRINELIMRDYEIQKDLAKKIYKQELIDEQTRYELEKDFLERQRELEEKRLLQEARLKEVARIQKEIISKDLGLEESAKEKSKELKELKEANNEVTKIKNEIIKIESSDFDEIWQANEPFQNEETGQWYYHDGEGNIYESNENGEWIENTANIKNELEKIKQQKVAKLLEEKDKAQLRQEKSSTDEYLNKGNEGLDANTLEKVEKNIEKDEEMLKELVIEKEDKILNLQEKHPANEPWLGEDNKYYYHDGNGNYFTTNENNEWVATINPEIKKIEEEFDKKKQAVYASVELEKKEKDKKKEDKKEKNKDSEFLPKPNEAYEFEGKWYYFDQDGNYFTTNENNEWVSTINPHASKKSIETDASEKTKALEDNYDHSEPFQDENGVWWYIDENNQYYYADTNGNWIKWEEDK